jgi:hypothetical protein
MHEYSNADPPAGEQAKERRIDKIESCHYLAAVPKHT